MSQTRKRYKSRREKIQRHNRNARLILIFGAIALVLMAIFNRHELWIWLDYYVFAWFD